jgi:hypothetical protein
MLQDACQGETQAAARPARCAQPAKQKEIPAAGKHFPGVAGRAQFRLVSRRVVHVFISDPMPSSDAGNGDRLTMKALRKLDPHPRAEVDTLKWLDDDRLLVGTNTAPPATSAAVTAPATSH